MSASALTYTLAQINPVVGDLSYNAGIILEHWRASDKSDIVIFPELCVTGYPPEDLVLYPAFLKDVRRCVQDICNASRDFAAAGIIGCPWEIDGCTYNVVHVIERGEIIATVKKHHLPNDGVFDEKRVFIVGDLPDPVDFRGARLGIMICEDMWHDNVAAHLAKKGADILIVPNASPFTTEKYETRLRLAKNRVKETGLPLLYVNQWGGQDEIVFDGGGFVIEADGQHLEQMRFFDNGCKDFKFEDISASKKIIYPTHYDNIYRAVTTGLRDYVEKNSFKGVLIGLSGGVDSALAAVLAVDALGANRVRCVMMPSQYTSKASLNDAAALAKNLGVRLDTISIQGTVLSLENAITGTLPENPADITFENLQSRARGIILMALSNACGYMVLSTGNKSEMAVGYATLYGDMCGGFNPLKDLYKMEVYALCNWRNKNKPNDVLGSHGSIIPANILIKAPTAELKDNQTDQDSLPPYETLDAILSALIEDMASVDEITARGFDRDIVLNVQNLLTRAEYKRRQAPPGVKVTARAFGRDRRMPITNKYQDS